MNSSGNGFRTLFLCLLSLHLGLSMELPVVIWLGIGVSVLGLFRVVRMERPTWGLLFVLIVSGIFIGNQVLEDWAVEGSWPQDNGLGAGFLLSMLIYLLWLHLAKPSGNAPAAQVPLERDNQNIIVWGVLILLVMSPPDATVFVFFGLPLPLIAIAGMLTASLVLFGERCAHLLTRAALLAPLLLIVPLLHSGLSAGQGPILGALGNLFPRSSNFTPTGFSPSQQLRAQVFLRPSTRAVMRVQADAPPNKYLAGNRLAVLDADLAWQAIEQPFQTLTTLDAEALPSGEYRYPLPNHQAANTSTDADTLTIFSLTSDNYIFATPGTSHVVGRFAGMTRSAADIWMPAFERGADRRWQLDSSQNSVPEAANPGYLQLPALWDEALQAKSAEFAGPTPQTTVDNVLQHFLGRAYVLETNFDPEQPLHDFFLNDKGGYCFWFATATTLALRANGIPSRLVGGYVIHEQLTPNLWLVRERDAHSWVEWQDEAGFWHTIDPTPSSIFGFFNGYPSSQLSVWYHALAGQWQLLLDRILADETTANLIAWGGLATLAFLFIREYRRIRVTQAPLDGRSLQWQKLWQRFLKLSQLPENAAWTASTYAQNLPSEWPASRIEATRHFLHAYNQVRFSSEEMQALEEAKLALDEFRLRTAANSSADDERKAHERRIQEREHEKNQH